MSMQWRTSWARRKSQLVRGLFEDLQPFSPIEEKEELTPNVSATTPRPPSPLPELIVEREKNPHDETEEFYEDLETRMLRLYRILFYLDPSDDSFCDEEIREATFINDEVNEDLISEDYSVDEISKEHSYRDHLDDELNKDQIRKHHQGVDQISKEQSNGDHFDDDELNVDARGEGQGNVDHPNDETISENQLSEEHSNGDHFDDDEVNEHARGESQINNDHINDDMIPEDQLSEEHSNDDRFDDEDNEDEISEDEIGDLQDTSGDDGLEDSQASTLGDVSAEEEHIDIEEMRNTALKPTLRSSMLEHQRVSEGSPLLQRRTPKTGTLIRELDEEELENASDSFLNAAQMDFSLPTRSSYSSTRKRSGSSLVCREPSPKRMYKDVGVQAEVPLVADWEDLKRDFFRGTGRLYRLVL